MGKLLRLARLQFLVAGLALFVFGALVAVLLGAPFSLGRLVLGCLIVLPAQLSVNFSNDYFDAAYDRLWGTTFISGGSSILLRYPELRQPAKWLAIGLILFSLVMGVVFQQLYSYPFWMLGFVVLGNLAGWIYSAPPFRLSRRGLGELCFTFVVGFLVPAMGYLTLRGILDAAGVFLLLPLILYGLVFILSVEIPDMEVDRLADKRNWVARFGRRFGFIAVGLLTLGATAYFLSLPRFVPQQIPMDFRVAGGLSLLPLLPGLWGWVRQPEEKQPATRIATALVIALALFAILMDVYLLLLTGR
ncbi:MAG TPA: prenyltransferase [Anaerolineales bacterium]|nr:prenyltransferase [Anaerolineales bacterium]